MTTPVSCLRKLIRELRLSRPSEIAKKVPLTSCVAYKYVISKYREGRNTDELMRYGEIWYLYMKSRREHLALVSYYSRGEKSIHDAAKTVGLTVPQIYE